MSSDTTPCDSPVIIAVDGTDRGRDALALGRLLGGLTHAPLLLACVYAYGDKERAEAVLELSRRDVVPVCDASATALPGASAASALEALARETDAAAIVVGSTHRGAFGRVLPGSTAEQLLRAGACPVAVAPAGFAATRTTSLRRLGGAFIDTREGWDAVAVAYGLARARGTSLRLLGVLAPSSWADAPGPGTYELHAALRAQARQSLINAAAVLPGDVPVERRLLEGPPVRVLANASRRLDLLVVGSRGHGLLSRALGTGVSSTLLNGAVCPVLAVPPRGATALLRALETHLAGAAA